MFEYEETRLATDSEAVAEFADNAGIDLLDRQWLLDSRDVWVRNPHYSGPEQRHPESDDDETQPSGGDSDWDDLPF